MNQITFLSLALLSTSTLTVSGQGEPPTAPTAPPAIAAEAEPSSEVKETPTSSFSAAPNQRGKLQSFAFESAPLEVVMEEYSRWTGKIFLKTDQVTASITVKADKITTEESIKVVEAILAMNNIGIIPWERDYVKVINATATDTPGMTGPVVHSDATKTGDPNQFVTQIIPLRNVEIQEVQAAVQHVLHTYGKIMALQGSNSLMITDTREGVQRALEIIEFIDKATSPIETRIYKIEHAEATEIAAKLNEIVTAAQGDSAPATANSRTTNTRNPPGVIRAGTRGNTAANAPTQASIGQTERSSATMISGTVKVLPDERTGLVIIFSQKANFEFFDKMIAALDVPVVPAIGFEVINLEFADAMELSGTLNDLVGAVTSGGTTARTGSSATSRNNTTSRNTTSRNTTSSRNNSTSSNRRVTPNAAEPGASAINNLARLSENTKILADERTNSILLMGEKGDIAAIKAVVKELDIMLEQVVIEAAIFEIGLSDSLRHGIDWLYRAQGDDIIGAWDGNTLITNAIQNVASGALSYYQNLAGIDSQILINLAATDNDARLVSTPNITTTDNTEATLRVGEQRPVVTSTDTTINSTQQRSNYEYKDIGIELIVTPQITPNDIVVMELSQKADQLGGNVDIDGNQVPIILNREFNAVVTVPGGSSVVLGGLINNEWADDVTKIPILGDIPLIGRYLFSSVSKTEVQRELLVVMTPTVMKTNSDIQTQTERLYKGSSLTQEDWQNGWSASPLRDVPDPEPVVEEQD